MSRIHEFMWCDPTASLDRTDAMVYFSETLHSLLDLLRELVRDEMNLRSVPGPTERVIDHIRKLANHLETTPYPLLPDPRLGPLQVASVSLRDFYRVRRKECFTRDGICYYSMSDTAREHFNVVMRNSCMFYQAPASYAWFGLPSCAVVRVNRLAFDVRQRLLRAANVFWRLAAVSRSFGWRYHTMAKQFMTRSDLLFIPALRSDTEPMAYVAMLRPSPYHTCCELLTRVCAFHSPNLDNVMEEQMFNNSRTVGQSQARLRTVPFEQ